MNVVERIYEWPIEKARKAKEIGKVIKTNVLKGLEGLGLLLLTKTLGGHFSKRSLTGQ